VYHHHNQFQIIFITPKLSALAITSHFSQPTPSHTLGKDNTSVLLDLFIWTFHINGILSYMWSFFGWFLSFSIHAVLWISTSFLFIIFISPGYIPTELLGKSVFNFLKNHKTYKSVTEFYIIYIMWSIHCSIIWSIKFRSLCRVIFWGQSLRVFSDPRRMLFSCLFLFLSGKLAGL